MMAKVPRRNLGKGLLLLTAMVRLRTCAGGRAQAGRAWLGGCLRSRAQAITWRTGHRLGIANCTHPDPAINQHKIVKKQSCMLTLLNNIMLF